MNFRQRLYRFLIGLFIGTLICFAIFGQRDWLAWTPGARVMDRLNGTEMQMTERAKCLMDCREITQDDLYYLLENGSVNFSKSKVQQEPMIYVVEAEKSEKQKFEMSFEARDSTSTLIETKWLDREIHCDC